MKQFLFLFLFVQSIVLNAQEVSQPTSLTPKDPKWDVGLLGGWMFAGSDGYGKVKNNFVFSPSIAYLYRDNLHVELSANFLSTELVYKSTLTAPERTIPFSQMYITGGLTRIFNVNSPVLEPYSMATIGGLYRSSSRSNSQWQFAVGIAFGVKYMLSSKVGLRAQARLQSSVNGIGIGVGVGTGGIGAGVGTYGSYVQFDLSGGMFIRL
jgi:hypothetical protein